jgi:hypothetical protein
MRIDLFSDLTIYEDKPDTYSKSLPLSNLSTNLRFHLIPYSLIFRFHLILYSLIFHFRLIFFESPFNKVW